MSTHAEMHRDHEEWLRETVLWREEVELWEKKNQEALADLAQIETLLRQHAQELRQHKELTTAHDARVHSHEHALAVFEEEGKTDELLLTAKRHRDETAKHTQERERHLAVKKRHHSLMSQWKQLLCDLARNHPGSLLPKSTIAQGSTS